jgi:hypothetical protein
MASSVYPDMYSTFICVRAGRIRPTRSLDDGNHVLAADGEDRDGDFVKPVFPFRLADEGAGRDRRDSGGGF